MPIVRPAAMSSGSPFGMPPRILTPRLNAAGNQPPGRTADDQPILIPGRFGPPPIPPEFERDPDRTWRQLPMSGRVRYAAQNLLTILLRYRKLDGVFIARVVEPYSYRVQRPKNPRPKEIGTSESPQLKPRKPKAPGWYLFAFDQTSGQSIKSFLVSRIVHVEVGVEHYYPRWDVEF